MPNVEVGYFCSVFNRVIAFLQQPYPFNANPKSYIGVVVVFAVFVALFLMVFQPFGIHQLSSYHVLWISLGFGAVTFLSLLLFFLLTQIFKDWFSDDNWTIGKEIGFGAFNFFAVGNGNYLYVTYGWYKEHIDFDYGGMMFATLTVGFFPYLFMLLTDHMRRFRLNSNAAQKLTSHLPHDSSSKTANTVTLIGENDGEVLTVEPDDVYFLASSGNYVEVVYNKEGVLSKMLLRLSLSKAEESFLSYPSFYRCHRTYLVNLEHVEAIEGNSQGYRLSFDQPIDSIPVARTKNQEFRDKLSELESQFKWGS